MTANPSQDVDWAAWWCTQQPRFEAASEENGWRHKLDAVNADIRAGMPIADALTKNRLPIKLDHAVTKGDPATLDGMPVEKVPVTGDYRCPATHACTRRGHPDPNSGHEPRCDVFGKTMILQVR